MHWVIIHRYPVFLAHLRWNLKWAFLIAYMSNLIKIRSFDPLLIVVIYEERIKGSNFN